MKKIWITILKVVVFIAVAVGTALFVNKLNNMGLSEASHEMDEPSLPVVYAKVGDDTLNRMQGYRCEMKTGLMRDCIIPLNENHGVTLALEDINETGGACSYELRSIDGDELIERGDLEGRAMSPIRTVYDINFRMDMKINTEYVLVFIVDVKSPGKAAGTDKTSDTEEETEKVRFYSRVVRLEKNFTAQFLVFTSEFRKSYGEKKVNAQVGNTAYNLLDEAIDGERELSHVTLKSDYDTLSFGVLDPITVSPVTPQIQEISGEYALVRYSYIIKSVSDSAEHFYYVDEFFALDYNESYDRVDILSYDRYMDSFFDEDYITPERNALSMGITGSGRVDYITSDNEKKLAFVKQGTLWYYDYSKATLAEVFSFMSNHLNDVRTLSLTCDINIVDMDDDGNLSFVVYGYMSRGRHEGKNGIMLMRYSAADASVSELAFIYCDEPFTVMQQEVGRFTYFDGEGVLYVLLDGVIYCVDLNLDVIEPLMAEIPSYRYLVSGDRKVVAYPDSKSREETTALHIHNFETGNETVKQGGDGERVVELGFVGNDIIYGVSKAKDIVETAVGDPILPMHDIYIIGENGDELKNYKKPGVYVMDASVDADTIHLTRAVKNGNFFTDTEPDYIVYRKETGGSNTVLLTADDPREGVQTDIVFPPRMYVEKQSERINTKGRVVEEFKEYNVESGVDRECYYVFDSRGFKGEYLSAGQAIIAVNEQASGICVNGYGNTVYRGIVADSYNTIADKIRKTAEKDKEKTLLACAYMCLDYAGNRVKYSDIRECGSFEQAFADHSFDIGVNISGISLDTALYFLDRDMPFAAQMTDGRYVLVISYNDTHIRYYDPVEDEEVRMTRDDFADEISTHSNTMYTYSSQ